MIWLPVFQRHLRQETGPYGEIYWLLLDDIKQWLVDRDITYETKLQWDGQRVGLIGMRDPHDAMMFALTW